MPSWIEECRSVMGSHVLPNGLKVAELPAGLMSGIRALKEVNIPVMVRHAYDICQCLKKQTMDGFSSEDQRNMYFGTLAGDLLKLTPEEMEIVHLLLSGPCCPPWSTLGTQGATKHSFR